MFSILPIVLIKGVCWNLADIAVLEAAAFGRRGSSPLTPTNNSENEIMNKILISIGIVTVPVIFLMPVAVISMVFFG